MYQKREKVFHHNIQTPQSELKICFFNPPPPPPPPPLQGAWIPDQTLFRVFDIASKLIVKCGKNKGNKIAIIERFS